MKINKDELLLCIGDSITDLGRARPFGRGNGGELGSGYVNLLSGIIGYKNPELNISVINVGTSGNTVRHLMQHWESDVLDLNPDWVTIMIGTNDVWRQFDSQDTSTHVCIDEYERTLEKLVMQTKPQVKGIILLSPFFIESNTSDKMRFMMDEYGSLVKMIANRHDVGFVDTQSAFNKLLQSTPSAQIAGDRVHPNIIGHTLLADCIYSYLNSDND